MSASPAGTRRSSPRSLRAQAHHKKIDGHAPGLSGKDLAAYIAAGVYSDHECSDMDDAMAKLRNGQFIMIRDGTAAHNLEALVDLLRQPYYDRCMFCTDDKHPSDLLEKGHIDYLIRKAIHYGIDPIVAVKTACHNPARYFALNNRGAIAPGYLADFAIIDNFDDFNVEMVFRKGMLTCSNGAVHDFEAPRIEGLPRRARARHVPCRPSDGGGLPRRPSARRHRAGPRRDRPTDAAMPAIDPQNDIFEDRRWAPQEHAPHRHRLSQGLRPEARRGRHVHLARLPHNIIVVGANEEDMAFAANRIVRTAAASPLGERDRAR